MPEISKDIRNMLLVSLDNFVLCRGFCAYLGDHDWRLPVPTKLVLDGPLPGCVVEAQGCERFVVPTITVALLDTRRLLQFLGLNVRNGAFVTHEKRDLTDYSIKDAGLPYVSGDELEALSLRIIVAPAFPLLDWAITLSNKQIAHFTTVEIKDDTILKDMVKLCSLMVEAAGVHIFDALGEKRPRIAGMSSEDYPHWIKGGG